MATTQEIRNLMSQPSRFDLMREELQTPGVLAEHEKRQEVEKKEEDLKLENSELKKNLDASLKENEDLKKQLSESQDIAEDEPKEEGAIKKLLNKFINGNEE